MSAELTTSFDVLIVGAGHGGAQAAIALRQRDFAGSIAVIGEEADLPYERPPLSKDYLAGDKVFERILIRSETFWKDRNVTFGLGERVDVVEPARKTVTLSDGSRLGYQSLIWAAGGHARRLTCGGADLRGVHNVRSRADVDRMIAELPDVERVIVVGGGYIGLEAAAVLSKFGKRIVVLEAQDRVLARVAGEPLSRFYEAEHRRHGVDVRLNVVVECIEGRGGAVTGVRLSDGTLLPGDMVIVGIGIVPSVSPVIEAGAVDRGGGVLVDEHCRTSLPDVYAIGDCATHASRFANGAELRLESVQNANDQALVVAKALTGTPEPYAAVPWFWSNQYDLKLQTIGLSLGYDFIVVRGRIADGTFSLVYLREGRVIALDCVNSTRDYAQGRALVAAGVMVPVAGLADTSIPLKELTAGA